MPPRTLEEEDPTLYRWLVGSHKPNSERWSVRTAVIDQVLILITDGHPTVLKHVKARIVPGNEMHLVFGSDDTTRLHAARDMDPSPLQMKSVRDVESRWKMPCYVCVISYNRSTNSQYGLERRSLV